MSLMPQQQKNSCEDENYIMQDSKFFLKIVSLEKLAGNNYNSTSAGNSQKIRIEIDLDEEFYATEERVFDDEICFFKNNIFTLPITTGYEKIQLKVTDFENSEVKASIPLKLSDFKDQKIHKRTYHLVPQKRYKDIQYEVQIRAFFQYNSYTFNRDKLAQRQETYLNIMKKLQEKEQRLLERLKGLEKYLDLICFDEQENSPQKNDNSYRVSKDFDSETASIYNELKQTELFFENREEEKNEFSKCNLFSDAPSPRSGHGNFSFDNMSDDGATGILLNQQILNQIIGSQRCSGTDTIGGGSNQSSPFKLNFSQQENVDIGQFISPRFQNETTTHTKHNQSQKQGEDDKQKNKQLIELKALNQETKDLITRYESKKNNIQTGRKIKSKIYDDLSKMSKQDLIKFRIFIRGLYAMNKINQQNESQLSDNKLSDSIFKQKSSNRMH